jgi:uncharacterized phiE125 gp8 family phage protein
MKPIRKQPPTEAPVTFEEFCDHVKPGDTEAEQFDIERKLAAAVDFIEDETRRALVTSTWEITLERWPVKDRYIELPLGNLQSVDSITYRDASGTVNTWPANQYRVFRTYDPAADGVSDAGPGRICPGYAVPWPFAVLDVGEPITIRFVCGWKDAESVPPQLKAAVLLYAGHLYRNREAVTIGSRAATGGNPEAVPMISTPLSMAIEALCARYKIYD